MLAFFLVDEGVPVDDGAHDGTRCLQGHLCFELFVALLDAALRLGM